MVIMAVTAALASLGVFLLLPRGTPVPPLAPASGAVNRWVEASDASSIYLFAERLDQEQSITLSWDWTVEDGRAHAVAKVSSAGDVNTDIWLILTGPIVNSIQVDDTSCTRSPTTTLHGQVPTGGKDGAGTWGNNYWEAPPDRILSIQLMAEAVAYSDQLTPEFEKNFTRTCSMTAGFASDDPPTHRMYQPRLMAWLHRTIAPDAQGKTLSSGLGALCVMRSWQGSRMEQACANPRDLWGASLDESLTERAIESEQGWRDARLLGLGVLAAAAAQALFELFKDLVVGAPDRGKSSRSPVGPPVATPVSIPSRAPTGRTILLGVLLAWFLERISARRR